MPKWDIDLSDGRTVTVESDLEPSEDEVLSAVGSQAQPQSPDIGSQFLFTPDPFALPTERERLASQAAEIRNAPPVTTAAGFMEEAVDRFGDFIGGAAQFVPSTLKAIGAGMSRPEALAENVPMIEPPPPGPPEEHPIYQAGTRAQQFVDESFPQSEEFDFPRAVVRGAGQMVPMLAGGAAARVLGAGPVAAAGVGAGIGTAMEFDDAFERSRRRGDNPDEAFAKSLGYATISGLIENRLGAGRILRQMFPNPVQAAQKLTSMGVSKKVIGNFIAGGAEEGSQQFAQNWIVEGEPSMENVAKSAAVGSVVEGVAGLPSAAVTPSVAASPPPPVSSVASLGAEPMSGVVPSKSLVADQAVEGALVSREPAKAGDAAESASAMPLLLESISAGFADASSLVSPSDKGVSVGKPQPPNATTDGSPRLPKNLTDLFDSKSIMDESGKNIDVEATRSVQPMVLSALKNPEVFNSVIQLIPVDVVNMLSSDKVSTQELLHDPSVFVDALSSDANSAVSLRILGFLNGIHLLNKSKQTKSRQVVAPAETVSVDDALLARGYGDFHIQKMSESEKQAEAAKPIPTPEEDAIRFWQIDDAIKQEKDINKRAALLQSVFMERELIKNRNPKLKGAVPGRPVVAAEPIGMGGATPSEFQPPKPFVTSNKNAVVDAERKERGLPPMMDLSRQGNQDAWDSAMRQIDENPQVQDELITELASTPRALTATENAMLMHRRIDLRNEYEKALLRWKQAFEGDDMVRAAEESQRVRDWSSKLSDLEDITKRTGAESGRSLQARKMMANEDYSLAAMELRAMESKGRNLTNQEHIDLIKAQQRILELENRLLELEGARESKEVESATISAMKEVSDEAPKESKSKDFDLDREEVLLSGIKAKVDKGQTNDITSLVQQLARVFWRRGIRGREPMIDALHETLKTIIPEFTRGDTKRAFSGYGNFKPLSKEEIDVGLRDLRGQTQQVLKMEALEARKPLEKTGQERRVPTDEERRLIKQVNELKRKYGVVVTDPATQLKSALAARKTYYEHRIADLKHEIETRQRIVKSKTASPTDSELDALIAEHERLKQEHQQIFVNPGMSDEQRLRQAIAAAQRNQAHWEVRLENAEKGIFDKRKPGRKVTSAELELIQAETAAIREHVKELEALSKPKKSKEEIALQSLKTRMKTREAEFRRRIAEKDFAKKVRQPVKLDAEGLKLKAALDLAKEEFETKLEQDRWARMSVFQKTKRKIADVYDAARALMTTGEFSFILRQGKLAALSHPIQTAKALPDMFRALLANEKRAHEIDLQTHDDPEADAARAAKLYLVEEGPSLHKQEEILMGRWVGKIPVVKNFNRAAQVFLNRIRLDMWKAMRRSLTKSGTPTPEEDRQIAMFVNEATGRGGLGKLEPAAVPLARIMFSPRYYASRLQLASGHSLWGGTMRTRRIIATEYARALVGLGLYYTALSMMFAGDDDDPDDGKIEVDPRSANFGKVKVGDTQVDPLAGLSQVLVLGARTATGEKKTLGGEVQSIRGKDVEFGGDKWSDIVARHLRGKLHPVPSSIANLFDGTDLGGDEATVVNQAGNLIAPITYVDIYAALKEQGLDDGAALALLALLGEGIQTYKKKEQ